MSKSCQAPGSKKNNFFASYQPIVKKVFYHRPPVLRGHLFTNNKSILPFRLRAVPLRLASAVAAAALPQPPAVFTQSNFIHEDWHVFYLGHNIMCYDLNCIRPNCCLFLKPFYLNMRSSLPFPPRHVPVVLG